MQAGGVRDAAPEEKTVCIYGHSVTVRWVFHLNTDPLLQWLTGSLKWPPGSRGRDPNPTPPAVGQTGTLALWVAGAGVAHQVLASPSKLASVFLPPPQAPPNVLGKKDTGITWLTQLPTPHCGLPVPVLGPPGVKAACPSTSQEGPATSPSPSLCAH